MARHVIVATFPSRNQAYDAAWGIQRLPDDIVDVKCGAIVEKDRLGNVSTLDTMGLPTVWGLGGVVGGAFVGALIGALAGPVGSVAGAAVVSSGLATGGLAGGALGVAADVLGTSEKQDYFDQVRRELLPGKTALVAEVSEISTVPVDTVVQQHGGDIYRSAIPL